MTLEYMTLYLSLVVYPSEKSDVCTSAMYTPTPNVVLIIFPFILFNYFVDRHSLWFHSCLCQPFGCLTDSIPFLA